MKESFTAIETKYIKNRKAFMVKAFKFGFLSTKLIFSVVIFIAKINLWL